MNPKRKAFIQEQYRKLEQYITDVESGKIIVGKWVKLAVKRYKQDITGEKYELRTDKLDKFFYFLSYTKILIGDRYRLFNPLPWQCFYFAAIYGVYHKGQERRKHNTTFLTVARKNGKSTIAAVQSAYALTSDGHIDGQCYVVSGSQKMANICLDITKALVANSPALAKRVEVLQYSLRHTKKKSKNIMKALVAQFEKLNGLRGNFVCLDEMHVLKTSQLLNIMRTGQAGIHNPLLSIISTRGFDSTVYMYDYEAYLKRVLEGEIEEDSTFALIFSLDSEEEIENPATWIKANPNLSDPNALRLESLETIYNQSRGNMSDLVSFIVLNINYWWHSSETEYIPTSQLEKVFVEALEDDLIAGESCYVGCDFSSTKDITSISLLFPPSENHEKFYVKNINVKTNSISGRVRKGGVDLTQHIESGDLIETGSNIIDYDYLYTIFEELSEAYNINIVGYDRFNSSLIIPRIRNNIGLETVDVPQTTLKLNQPTKYLEKLIFDEQIILDNQVTKWMFKNTQLFFDMQGNVKPTKKQSKESIDSVMAILCAVSCYIDEIGEEQLNYVATAV